jgi:hypothetical protein
MLLNGVNHVAILTKHTDRLVACYREVFEAGAAGRQGSEGFWLTIIRLGEAAELNVFEIDGNTEADRQTPMFGKSASPTPTPCPGCTTRLVLPPPATPPSRSRHSAGHVLTLRGRWRTYLAEWSNGLISRYRNAP